jgi:hypothetical protein
LDNHLVVPGSPAPLEELRRQDVGGQSVPILAREVEIEGSEYETDLSGG